MQQDGDRLHYINFVFTKSVIPLKGQCILKKSLSEDGTFLALTKFRKNLVVKRAANKYYTYLVTQLFFFTQSFLNSSCDSPCKSCLYHFESSNLFF